jgi:hypothetical protein
MVTFVWSAHKLADSRWEILGPDDDPGRPPWRRLAIIDSAAEQSHLTMPRDRGRGSPADLIRLRARGLRRVA